MRRAPFFAVLLFAAPARADGPPILPDVVYGHKDGMALTYDVVRPAAPNGAAILWIQSGGWYSGWNDPAKLAAGGKPYLDKGYALVIVRHGSAPRFGIADAVADVRRAVRSVRLKAKELGIDPERLGVTGGSAGGHLALMLGTSGDDGDPASPDPVLRRPSRVAAVVSLYPPTDLRPWVNTPEEFFQKYPGLRAPLTFDPKVAPAISPVTLVTPRAAPTLLIHGDKDELVPISHSRNIVPLLESAKVPHKLVVVEGAGHAFTPAQYRDTVLPATLDWFGTHLAAKR